MFGHKGGPTLTPCRAVFLCKSVSTNPAHTYTPVRRTDTLQQATCQEEREGRDFCT